MLVSFVTLPTFCSMRLSFESSRRKYRCLCSSKVAVTFVAITGLARMLPNSSVSFNGSTMLTWPWVASATCPRSTSLQLVPLMLMTDTDTLKHKAHALFVHSTTNTNFRRLKTTNSLIMVLYSTS
ncbi:hypothetical protein NP493_511g00037 [Ridgeia piscesae]|uniref:Uncharacterized protein n=1 Tax=Ridgeia piscesae TaxID=27915 RepID=A0AAD9KYA8_RIDPI|nr:hypothetical protein NP493_511g00037 [Ridgeia piscesae]